MVTAESVLRKRRLCPIFFSSSEYFGEKRPVC
jgi:hypothetical protein